MRRIIIGMLAALSLCGVAQAAPTLIHGPINAEDLAPLPGSEWVIASSMAGGRQGPGGFWIIDAGRKTASVAKLEPAPGTQACPAGFDPEKFAPHGLVAARQGAGWTLHVVNHGGREAVERFDVQVKGGTPTIIWRDCVVLPEGGFANNLAVTANGTIAVSNMGRALGAESGGPGDLLLWSQEKGWQSLPGSRRAAWNGVLVSPDGSHIYAASWSEKRVYEFIREGEKTVSRSVAVDFLADNLRWDGEGALLVAGQASPPDPVMNCFMSKAPQCGLASGFARIEIDGMTVTCSQILPPTPEFDSATTALPVAGRIWLGTMRGDAVESVEACGTGAGR